MSCWILKLQIVLIKNGIIPSHHKILCTVVRFSRPSFQVEVQSNRLYSWEHHVIVISSPGLTLHLLCSHSALSGYRSCLRPSARTMVVCVLFLVIVVSMIMVLYFLPGCFFTKVRNIFTSSVHCSSMSPSKFLFTLFVTPVSLADPNPPSPCSQDVLSKTRPLPSSPSTPCPRTVNFFHGPSSGCLVAYSLSAMTSPWTLTSSTWPSLAALLSPCVCATTPVVLFYTVQISTFPKLPSRWDRKGSGDSVQEFCGGFV